MTDTGENKNKNRSANARKSPALRQISRSEPQNEQATPKLDGRKLTAVRKSRRILLLSVFGIILLFIALIFLLYNQSKVIEINFRNASLEQQIVDLTEKNAQRREIISKNLDLSTIRTEAERLGLREPLQSQIIEVKVPETDQIVVNIDSANAQGVDPGDTDMEEIFTNLEGFFRTVR